MSYRIDLDDLEEFMLASSNTKNVSHKLPNNFGRFLSNKEIIHQDILMFKTRANIDIDNLEIESKSHVSGLSVIVGIEGSINYIDKSNKNSFLMKENEVLTKYSNSHDGIIQFGKKANITSLCLVIRDEFLDKYLLTSIKKREHLENNYNKNISTDLRQSQANQKIRNLAKELFYSPYEGKLNDLYIQSKAYELIFEEFKTILDFDNKKLKIDSYLNKDDIESLHEAKRIIESSIEFYSINELCKKVAINEFKLKYGFKKLFNTSPGALVLEMKMNKAKELLLTQDYNISEVAEIIGYKYPQSFSYSFSKYFGVPPKTFLKSRKYHF